MSSETAPASAPTQGGGTSPINNSMNPELKTATDALNNLLSTVQTHIDILNGTSSLDIAAMDKADLQITLAYVLHSLCFVYLRLSAADPKSHKILNEIGRVRERMETAKMIRRKINAGDSFGGGPSMRIDQDASRRIIAAETNNVELKEAIKKKRKQEDDEDSARETNTKQDSQRKKHKSS